MLANDPIPRVLYIDLARRRSWVEDAAAICSKPGWAGRA